MPRGWRHLVVPEACSNTSPQNDAPSHGSLHSNIDNQAQQQQIGHGPKNLGRHQRSLLAALVASLKSIGRNHWLRQGAKRAACPFVLQAKIIRADGAALPQAVQQSLASELAKIPNAFSVLCYVDNKPAGLVNCFTGFSTFKCKPLVNIHDVTVFKDFRGLGLSQRMLKKVEQIAQERGCCKLTLEVLEGNEIARNAYLKLGFDSYELDPAMGRALFWQKLI